MKQKKKLLSILLSLALVVGMVPMFGVTASAAEMCTVTFHNNGHGTLKVESIQVEKGKVVNGSEGVYYQDTLMGKADGLQHSGWGTTPSAALGSKDQFGMNSTIQEDLDLYAIWSHYIDHVELSLPESSKPVAGAPIPAEPEVDLIYPANPSTEQTYYEIYYTDADWIKDTVWLDEEGNPVTTGTFVNNQKYTLRVNVFSWLDYKQGPLPFTADDRGKGDMTSATLDGKQADKIQTENDSHVILYFDFSVGEPVTKYQWYANGAKKESGLAAKGETVTLTAIDDGESYGVYYTFSHWKVLDGNVTLSDPTKRTVSFTMPAEEVAVEAVFEEKPENPFTDVFESDYYYTPVLWAYYHEPQITNGISATQFAPKNTVKRCECVTFLWRAMGCPEPKSAKNPFTDVQSGDYFYKPVLWAVENGITVGTTKTTFAPDDTLSTAHMITFLYRTKNPGKDGWYEEAASWATDKNGKPFGVNLAVNNATNCPRGAVVTFLYELMNNGASVNQLGDDFVLYVEEFFKITGRGRIVTGRVQNGSIRTGEELVLRSYDGSGTPTQTRVSALGIEMFRKILDEAEKGDNIGLLISEDGDLPVKQGDAVTSADSGLLSLTGTFIGTIKRNEDFSTSLKFEEETQMQF